MTKIPVYEYHDGRAYDGFIKTVAAEVTPTAGGVSSRVQRVTLRKEAGVYRLDDSVPVNTGALDDATLAAIVSREYDYNGGRLPLYNLHTKAWRIAERLGLVTE